jgi:hypothetical protein
MLQFNNGINNSMLTLVLRQRTLYTLLKKDSLATTWANLIILKTNFPFCIFCIVPYILLPFSDANYYPPPEYLAHYIKRHMGYNLFI